MADWFADGAWLAELAGVADRSALGESDGARIEQGGVAMEALADALGAGQASLVLECEHLIDAGSGRRGTLLPAADDVRTLATSREPVGWEGEVLHRPPPLLCQSRQYQAAEGRGGRVVVTGPARWTASTMSGGARLGGRPAGVGASTGRRWRSSWPQRVETLAPTRRWTASTISFSLRPAQTGWHGQAPGRWRRWWR